METLLREIEDRRNDGDFMARLRARVQADADLLDRLAAGDAPHCSTCMCGRRAPVQGDKQGGHGTITWAEHEQVWKGYAADGHGGQSAKRIAERGGFGYGECVRYLGHEPTTWRAS